MVTGYFVIARAVTRIMEAAGLASRPDWQRVRRIRCDMISPLWIQDDCTALEVSVRWALASQDALSLSFELLSGSDKVLRRGVVELWPGEKAAGGASAGDGDGDGGGEDLRKGEEEGKGEAETESERWFREARMAVSAGKIPKL